LRINLFLKEPMIKSSLSFRTNVRNLILLIYQHVTLFKISPSGRNDT